mgnify:CR=1 FL=1
MTHEISRSQKQISVSETSPSQNLKTPLIGGFEIETGVGLGNRPVSKGAGETAPTLFVRTVHQVWVRHPILGDLPFGPRYEARNAPLPVDRFSFDDVLDAHEACILLEDYLRRHRGTPTRKRK